MEIDPELTPMLKLADTGMVRVFLECTPAQKLWEKHPCISGLRKYGQEGQEFGTHLESQHSGRQRQMDL